jgi:hypothetical protein
MATRRCSSVPSSGSAGIASGAPVGAFVEVLAELLTMLLYPTS